MTDRFRNTANIWNWLPAFRAVAETEHLPTASEMMNVTAPALSRTVKQLEAHLGYQLFKREGRGIQLNDRGNRLLVAVRDAMRMVDDALAVNAEERFTGPLRWTSNWSLSGATLEALSGLVEEHPQITPRMHPLNPATFATELLRGDLDLAVVTTAVDRDGLTAAPVGELPHSIYCGQSHSLFGRDEMSWEDLEGRRFAAPLPDDSGQYHDGWPAERPREVVMEFAQMSVGFRACRDGGLLAVLPDDVAIDEEGLWRLKPVEGHHHAFAVHRVTLQEPGPVEALLDGLRDILQTRHSETLTMTK